MRFRVHAEGTSRANFRSRIAGRTISVDHLPDTTGAHGWGEVLFTLPASPNTTVVRTLGGSDLARAATVTVDAGGDCFHRLQVVDRHGQVIAFGQPTWTLQKPPPTGIPDARLA